MKMKSLFVVFSKQTNYKVKQNFQLKNFLIHSF